MKHTERSYPNPYHTVTSSWPPDSFDERPEPPERAEPPAVRPPYRPPIGIPARSDRRIVSTVLSVALHALVILILLAPVVGPRLLEEVQGAGGAGPAGGGGGGTRGTGGDQGLGVVERLHYIQITPPVATPTPAVPVPVPPKEQPKPVPPVTPTVVPPATPPVATTPSVQQTTAAAAPVPGTGGGTGADGTAGSGPGSGGGVGSGVGTGRGAGVGAGTGGGNATVYPPQATEIYLAPYPVPDKVKGTQVVAEFDVDSLGHVLSFDFTPTRDGGYNRKLREVLSAVKFRPGTRADGQPMRAKGSLTFVF